MFLDVWMCEGIVKQWYFTPDNSIIPGMVVWLILFIGFGNNEKRIIKYVFEVIKQGLNEELGLNQ